VKRREAVLLKERLEGSGGINSILNHDRRMEKCAVQSTNRDTKRRQGSLETVDQRRKCNGETVYIPWEINGRGGVIGGNDLFIICRITWGGGGSFREGGGGASYC